MLEILRQTPTWVFPLFFCLVYVGYLQSKTREASRSRLVVVPVAMICLSLYGTWSAFGANPLGFAAWIGGAGLVLTLSGALRQPPGVSYSTGSGRLTVPGSWVPMGLIMAIFFTKYFVSTALATEALSPRLPAFVGLSSFAFGLLSGAFLARALQVRKSARQVR
jgi:hypothetical protein